MAPRTHRSADASTIQCIVVGFQLRRVCGHDFVLVADTRAGV